MKKCRQTTSNAFDVNAASCKAHETNDVIEGVVPSMRNRLDNASVAQSLDGEPSAGEPAFPRCSRLCSHGDARKTAKLEFRSGGSTRFAAPALTVGRLLQTNRVPYNHDCTGMPQSPR